MIRVGIVPTEVTDGEGVEVGRSDGFWLGVGVL